MYSYRAQTVSFLSSLLIPLALALGTARAAQDTAMRAVPSATGQRAEIVANVPADAIIWVDGRRTNTTGTTRRFLTPPLDPGQTYGYDLRISWVEGARSRLATRHVTFRAGARVTLDLAQPSWTKGVSDVYMDPAAPAPWGRSYYQNPLNYPNYPNLFTPGINWRPR